MHDGEYTFKDHVAFGNKTGFGFTAAYIPVFDFLKLVKKRARIETRATTTGQDQPCSIHGKHAVSEGTLVNDIMEGEQILKAKENHYLEDVSEQTKKHLKRLVDKLGKDILTAKWSFWTFRDAMTAIKQLRAGRYLKFSKPYSKELYHAIKKCHNEIVIPNKEHFFQYFDKTELVISDIATWTYQDYLDKRSHKCAKKNSGPGFSKLLDRDFVIDDEEKMAINEWCEANHANLPEWEDRTYTWRVIDIFLRWSSTDVRGKPVGGKPYPNEQPWFPIHHISLARQLDLWGKIQNWYIRMAVDIHNLIAVQKEYISQPFPEDWENWTILCIAAHELHGVVAGIRDSCDVEEILLSEDFSIIGDKVSENAQRIVGRPLSACASLGDLSGLATQCIKSTEGRYVGTGKKWVEVKTARGGLDFGVFDAFVGACVGLSSYITFKRYYGEIRMSSLKLIAIGLLSGEAWTQVMDSQLAYEIWKKLGLIMYILGILGDDQLTTVFPVFILLQAFYLYFGMLRPLKKGEKPHKIFGNKAPIYELLKPKQSEWYDQKLAIHFNFNLGITVVFKNGVFWFYFRAIKIFATKQSPEGVNKIELGPNVRSYSYEEFRGDKPTLDDLWNDQGWLFYSDKLEDLNRILEPGVFEKMIDTEDVPGSFENIEFVT